MGLWVAKPLVNNYSDSKLIDSQTYGVSPANSAARTTQAYKRFCANSSGDPVAKASGMNTTPSTSRANAIKQNALAAVTD